VERILWFALRDRLYGWKFRRQHPIGRRVVDFACPERKLVIELDGGQHALRTEADALDNLDGVLETIRRALESDPPPLTPPP